MRAARLLYGLLLFAISFICFAIAAFDVFSLMHGALNPKLAAAAGVFALLGCGLGFLGWKRATDQPVEIAHLLQLQRKEDLSLEGDIQIPYVTLAIAVFLGLAFTIATFINGSDLWAAAPDDLIRAGGLGRWLIAKHEYWRLLTYSVVHLGLYHLIGNLVGLLTIGPEVERRYGPGNLLLLFLAGGLLAGCASMIFAPSLTVTVGASGAVFALYGAFLMKAVHPGSRAFRRIRFSGALTSAWFVLAAFAHARAGDGIDHYAHFGGLMSGMIFGFFLIRADEAPFRLRATFSALALSGVTICLIATLPRLPQTKKDLAAIQAKHDQQLLGQALEQYGKLRDSFYHDVSTLSSQQAFQAFMRNPEKFGGYQRKFTELSASILSDVNEPGVLGQVHALFRSDFQITEKFLSALVRANAIDEITVDRRLINELRASSEALKSFSEGAQRNVASQKRANG